MFGLNENTQYYVCQRYVRMNMGINGLYQIVRTEMELPPLGGLHLLLKESPAGKNAKMGWRRFLAVSEATGARNL